MKKHWRRESLKERTEEWNKRGKEGERDNAERNVKIKKEEKEKGLMQNEEKE